MGIKSKIKNLLFLKLATMLVLSVFLSVPTYAQKEIKKTRVLFIFDASQSMYAKFGSKSRMDVAKNLLINMLDSLRGKENLEVALRVYGHQKPYPPQYCDDTKLEVDFGSNNISSIQNRLKTINPKGTTSIAQALESGAYDFPSDATNARNIVILITDGIEECEGDPCAISRLYQEKKVILKPFVIGIGLKKDFQKTFDCVGTFYDAKDPDTFKNILNVVVSQVLNSSSVQVNLLDNKGFPTETNVPISFYDAFSGKLQYNFVHTMNYKGIPDTLKIDPVLSYRVVAHTIPPVESDKEWKLNPGKHTIIPLLTPQANLTLSMGGRQEVNCLVKLKGEEEILNVQKLNTSQNYIIGEYDLEFLTLPRIKHSVSIKQDSSYKVIIPQPSLVILSFTSSGYGSIFEDENELKWVTDINSKKGKQNIYLMPGNYRIIYRAKNASESIFTKDLTFKVLPNKTVSLKL
jgi:Ca-activated chloride channel family protein